MAGPVGPKRADALTAYIIQTLYATSGSKKKPPTLDKLMPKWHSGKTDGTKLTPEQQRDAFFNQIAAVAPKQKDET